MYNREKIISTMYDIVDESKSIKPYVLVAQPRRDKTEKAAQNFDGYDGLHIDFNGFSHGFVDISGEKVDVARNYLMERAIESGAKYLLFIGEDTVVPMNAFKILHDTAEANPDTVVTGVYYIKLSSAMIMVKKDDWITVPNVDPGQLIEAWQTGMDIMLIPISILKRMKDAEPEVPFCCIGTGIDDLPFIGEDNFFVHRLRKMNYKLLVNTDVQCLHMDLASGKYTAHPDVILSDYFTQIPITTPLTQEDKLYIDKRWVDRLPKGSNNDTSNKLEEALKQEVVKFNMGSGRDKFPGYVNVDLYSQEADIHKDLLMLNLPEECADEIFASHVIEHIPYFYAPNLLARWYSNLKVGGKLIMELPNLEGLCEEFLKSSDEERFVLTLCIYGSSADCLSSETEAKGTSNPHVWGYYPSLMMRLLEEIGFKDIQILPQQGKHIGSNFRVEAVK